MSEKNNLEDLLNDLKADAQKAKENPQQPQQQQQQQPQQQQESQSQGLKKVDKGSLYAGLFLLGGGILLAVAVPVWFIRFLVAPILFAAGITGLVEYSKAVNRKK